MSFLIFSTIYCKYFNDWVEFLLIEIAIKIIKEGVLKPTFHYILLVGTSTQTGKQI